MKKAGTPIGRRELLVRTAPACAMACLSAGCMTELAGAVTGAQEQETHKFDRVMDPPPPPLTPRTLARIQYGALFGFINTIREEMGEPEVIRLLKANTEGIGRGLGEGQARRARERGEEASFANFVAQFRPPRYEGQLTHEVVTDTGGIFELHVTECVSASVFQEAGHSGEIGHAAVCNMDYAWPTAYNPAIRMERSKTLMQGHDCCNHRYLLAGEE